MQDNDGRVDMDDRKGKEKVEDKGKEPVFFMGVSFVDLDDLDVSDNRLHCDNNSSDDDDTINLEDMDVGDGGASSSQCLEPGTGSATELLQSLVPVHSDRPSKSIPSNNDVLYNAAGKAPHPDVVIVKQEAGWFQEREEKCKKKIVEKLAQQQENERIAKEREDQRRMIAFLQELLQKQLGGNIDVLLPDNLGIPVNEPIMSTPASSLPEVPSVAFPTAGGASGSLSSSAVASGSPFL